MNPVEFNVSDIMHNSCNCDINQIISAIGRSKDKKISCIPNNIKKRFFDWLQFLNAFLDTN